MTDSPAPPWSYPILNPHPMTSRPDTYGRYEVLVHSEKAGPAYITLDKMEELERLGLIKIEQVGDLDTDLPETYNRIRVFYTILGVTS